MLLIIKMATSTNKSNAATKEPLTSTTVIGGETGTAGSDDIYNVQEKNMSKNVILRKFYHFNGKEIILIIIRKLHTL